MFDGVDTGVRIFYCGLAHWPHFRERVMPYLDKIAAGSGGRYETEDIVAAIHCGQFHLWLALEQGNILGALLTEVIQYPRMRAMRAVGIAGHRSRRWMPIGSAAIELASKIHFGCTRIEAIHSPDLERLIKPYGWKVWHVFSEKAL